MPVATEHAVLHTCIDFHFNSQASARLIESFHSTYPTFSFTIEQEVKITESFLPEFSITSFFADLGGALGLWLGVGAVQLSKSIVDLLEFI